MYLVLKLHLLSAFSLSYPALPFSYKHAVTIHHSYKSNFWNSKMKSYSYLPSLLTTFSNKNSPEANMNRVIFYLEWYRGLVTMSRLFETLCVRSPSLLHTCLISTLTSCHSQMFSLIFHCPCRNAASWFMSWCLWPYCFSYLMNAYLHLKIQLKEIFVWEVFLSSSRER